MSKTIKIYGVLKVKDLPAYLKLLPDVFEKTRQEPGCISYSCNQLATGENTGEVVWIETWRSMADFEAHLEMPHIKKFLKDIEHIIEGEADMQMFTPLELVPDKEKIRIFAEVTLKGDNNEEYFKLLPDLIKATLAEPGCISYVPNAKIGTSHKNKIYFIEEWRSQKDFDAHMNMPHVKQFMAKAEKHVAGIEIKQYKSLDF